MIFSRFFAPSHTSADPKTRIEAIAKLSADKPGDKSVLHELAFNDADANVSIAALRKLDDFALWQKMAQIALDPKVRRVAQQQVEQEVLSDKATQLTAAQKRTYLKESASADLICKVLMQDETIAGDDALALLLLDKIAKPAFTQQFFLSKASEALQKTLIDRSEDTDFLQRLQRKTANSTVKSHIDVRLNALKQALEKPLEIEKHTTLVLSKYQALGEKSDYQDVLLRRQTYDQEFVDLASQFDCLDNDTQACLNEKYQRIRESVERHLARLKPQFDEQQRIVREREVAASVAAQLKNAQQALDALYAMLGKDGTAELKETAIAALSGLDNALNAWRAEAPVQSDVAEIAKQAEALHIALSGFDSQHQVGGQVGLLLMQAQALPISDDNNAAWLDIRAQWQELTSALTIVPDTWNKQFRELDNQWRKARQAVAAERDHYLKQCRKQLSLIGSLIEAGRFKAAMAKFTRLSEQIVEFPDDVQKAMARRYQLIQEQIERLEGWQNYIAAPRKPALLEEAKALSEEEATDIPARAEKIKYLRQQWLTLCTADEDKADPQNRAFDAYLEMAFQPCRDFYAEQESLREAAASERKRLIEQLSALTVQDDIATVAQQFENLKQQWRTGGQVDKKQYQSLKQDWDSAADMVQRRVNEWQQHNRQQKQHLIEKAKLLASADDMQTAAAEAQALQQQWKMLGHAGRRHESKLWQLFKQANDVVFSQLKSQRQERQDAQQSKVKDADSQLAAIEKQLPELNSVELSSALAHVSEQAQTLEPKLKQRVESRISQMQKRHQLALEMSQTEQQQAMLKAVLNIVSNWNDSTVSLQEQIDENDWEMLDKQWQAAFVAPAGSRSREWLTVQLELSLELSSPASAESLRQDVQLAMLTAKLERGEEVTTPDIIKQWLAHGAVGTEDSAMLSRFVHAVGVYIERMKPVRR